MNLRWLQGIMDDTVLAVQFFSLLRIPDHFKIGRRQSKPAKKVEIPKLNEAIIAFPLAGLIVALPPAFLWLVCSQFLSPFLAAGIAIASGALVTGGLHEDGLADCADGLCGASTRERALEIMRDSSIGAYGAAALFFSFFLRIVALAGFSPWSGVLALFMTHSTARAFLAVPIHMANYARQSGVGNIIDNGVDTKQLKATLGVACAVSFLLVVFSGQFSGLLAPLTAALVVYGLSQYAKRRLGGYTGDSLGAMEQAFEVTVIIVLSALWS